MDLRALIITALTSSAFTTVVVAALAWLARSLVDRWLKRNLEQYKAELQAKNTQDLERLRMDLKISAFEYETRFSQYHTRRIEAIEELFQRLRQLAMTLNSLAAASRDKKEGRLSFTDKSVTQAIQEHKETWQFFEAKRLYLTEQLCDKLEGHLLGLLAALMTVAVSADGASWNSQTLPSRVAGFKEVLEGIDGVERAWAILKAQAEIMQDIEREFRKTLGYSNAVQSGGIA